MVSNNAIKTIIIRISVLVLVSTQHWCFSLAPTFKPSASRSSRSIPSSTSSSQQQQQQQHSRRMLFTLVNNPSSTALFSSIQLDRNGQPVVPSSSTIPYSNIKKRNLFDNNNNSPNIWLKGLQQRWTLRRGKNEQKSLSKVDTSLYGMPWKQSICPAADAAATTDTTNTLLYMPFYESQIAYMMDNLTNLRQVPCVSKTGQDMSYKEATDNTIRIHTICFTSDEYQLIRLTTVDGGSKTQVFTSLWYPNPSVRLPLLGIDLLQFNNKKHLCICDFQPIENSESLHDTMYEKHIKPIRDTYTSLQGTMTNRFYNVNDTYFSKNMLLGRYSLDDITDNESIMNRNNFITNELFPAIQSYTKTHVTMVKDALLKQQKQQTPAHVVEEKQKSVLKSYSEYDTYSASRDPAHALLGKMFGYEWADKYVYDVLFPSSTKEVSTTENTNNKQVSK